MGTICNQASDIQGQQSPRRRALWIAVSAPGSYPGGDDRLLYLGDDEDGQALEVICRRQRNGNFKVSAGDRSYT